MNQPVDISYYLLLHQVQRAEQVSPTLRFKVISA